MLKDRERIYRIIDTFEFNSIVERSPVQVQEGIAIRDEDTGELFASFTFRNLSEKEIASLSIRLLLYHDADIPQTTKVYFTYSAVNASFGIRSMPWKKSKRLVNKREQRCIRPTESFGKSAYMLLPHNYCKKLEIEFLSVEYKDGAVEKLGIVVPNESEKMSGLESAKRYAYSTMNKYKETEKSYPAVVIPQKSENAWLCCCGHKNLIANDKCEICGREKEWEFASLNDKKLSETVTELKRANDRLVYPRKNPFKGYQRPLTPEEEYQKKLEYEKVLRNLEEEERRKEHNNRMIIPKAFLYYAVGMLIIMILTLINVLVSEGIL